MTKMVQGKLKIMGRIDVNEPDYTVATYPMALLIEFDSAEDIRKALADNCCCYTFGEEKVDGTSPSPTESPEE